MLNCSNRPSRRVSSLNPGRWEWWERVSGGSRIETAVSWVGYSRPRRRDAKSAIPRKVGGGGGFGGGCLVRLASRCGVTRWAGCGSDAIRAYLEDQPSRSSAGRCRRHPVCRTAATPCPAAAPPVGAPPRPPAAGSRERTSSSVDSAPVSPPLRCRAGHRSIGLRAGGRRVASAPSDADQRV